MGLVTKAFTFAPQTLAASAEVNVNFDTLYALVNGNIEADNLAPNAVVADKITDDSINFNKIDWGTGADQVQGTELTHWRIGQGLANYLDIALPVLTGNRTWTLQDSSDVFVGRDTTDTLTNKTLTSPDINGGSIDGATVGGAVPAAGTFTTLNATGGGSLAGTWSDLGTITTVDINGGTVDGAVVGGASPAAGTFTTLNATGGGSLTGTWSDLGTITTADINGGTVDGAVVGGASPAAGTFTTLGATTGNITTVNASNVYGVPQICSKTFILPEYVQRETDVVPLLPVETSWAPQGIEVIKFGIKTDNASTYSCVLENWTAPNDASENISTVATAASREAESAALTYTVDAGNIVMVDLPATTGVKFLQVWFVYKVKAN